MGCGKGQYARNHTHLDAVQLFITSTVIWKNCGSAAGSVEMLLGVTEKVWLAILCVSTTGTKAGATAEYSLQDVRPLPGADMKKMNGSPATNTPLSANSSPST